MLIRIQQSKIDGQLKETSSLSEFGSDVHISQYTQYISDSWVLQLWDFLQVSLLHSLNNVWALCQLKIKHPRLLEKVAQERQKDPLICLKLWRNFLSGYTYVYIYICIYIYTLIMSILYRYVYRYKLWVMNSYTVVQVDARLSVTSLIVQFLSLVLWCALLFCFMNPYHWA